MKIIKTFESFINENYSIDESRLNEAQGVTLELKADNEWPRTGSGLTFIKIMYDTKKFIGIYFDSAKRGIVNWVEGSRGTETRKIISVTNEADANRALQIAFNELKDKKFNDTKQAENEIKKIVKMNL